jgi:hypothetical protein
MKTYRIGVFEEQGGYIHLKATSEKKAKEKAQELIDYYGMSEMPEKYALDITHRDTQLV